MKLLLVEDEKDLRDTIRNYLLNEGYVCEAAVDFDEGMQKMDLYEYDCLLVDLTLPGGNGLELVEEMKRRNATGGIIIISAKNALDDRITGLNLGADDYLTKPFHLTELNARIKSLLRRRKFEGVTEVVFGEITLQADLKTVLVHGKKLDLTPKEFGLLSFFLANPGRVVGKEALAEHIWGDQIDLADHFDFLYSHIKNLRKKLMDAGAADYIKTVYGMGYKFFRE